MSDLSLLAAHLLADFPLQSDRMAAEKLDDWGVRLDHVAVHAVTTALAVALTKGVDRRLPLFVAAVVTTHYGIDTRRWAGPKDGFEAYPLAVDQTLHVVALATLSAAVYGE
ncbi:DUF3307 domain-containing protein [Halomarina oriensis]|uniref:DUF3307 domain-containing protein n=1 Tax=Halomarina oriensis TaxID=671145 RepID=A0A6B0GVD7_9EURY|nr:DUF3307 domain-containing protein [Halomarina oriensis]MWG36553.1 DUF3307 domain-containing protein [Halomarina oriensis]